MKLEEIIIAAGVMDNFLFLILEWKPSHMTRFYLYADSVA